MTIRVPQPSAILAAASVAALLGLTGCGPTSEPIGQTADTETAASSPAAEPAAEPAATESTGPTAPESPVETADDGGATTAAEPGADDNDPALCDAADLTGSIENVPGGATAGSVYRGLVVENTSNEDCVLLGYPGVSYVQQGDKTALGAPAVRDESKPSVSIDLVPGAEAMAILKQTNAQNYGERCHQVEADGLLVYPPSAYDSLFIEQTIPACSAEDVELMTIGAFQPVE